jgi:hypothetical protein
MKGDRRVGGEGIQELDSSESIVNLQWLPSSRFSEDVPFWKLSCVRLYPESQGHDGGIE